jgi:hypothetical protein
MSIDNKCLKFSDGLQIHYSFYSSDFGLYDTATEESVIFDVEHRNVIFSQDSIVLKFETIFEEHVFIQGPVSVGHIIQKMIDYLTTYISEEEYDELEARSELKNWNNSYIKNMDDFKREIQTYDQYLGNLTYSGLNPAGEVDGLNAHVPEWSD